MKCEAMLRNLGYEAREVEPQPCGKPAHWITNRTDGNPDSKRFACEDHLGLVIPRDTPYIWKVVRYQG